jgi:hypothetical protein
MYRSHVLDMPEAYYALRQYRGNDKKENWPTLLFAFLLRWRGALAKDWPYLVKGAS